jgi:hypothetical protein
MSIYTKIEAAFKAGNTSFMMDNKGHNENMLSKWRRKTGNRASSNEYDGRRKVVFLDRV